MASAFAAHPRDVRGDPDLLNITQPEIVSSIHDAYFAAGADIATTNTFTATSIGQADYGLEDAVRRDEPRGRAAGPSGCGCVDGEGSGTAQFVAGSVGPLNVTLSLSPRVDDPAYRTHTFDQVQRSVRGADRARSRDGGVDLLLIETSSTRSTARRRSPRPARGRARAAAVALRDDRRPVRAHALGPDGRGLVDCRRARRAADRRRELLARRDGDAAVRGGSRPRRARPTSACHPNAGLPNAFGGYDERPRTRAGCSPSSPADGLVERRRRLLRHDAGAHRGDRGCGRAPRPATGSRTAARDAALRAWSRSRSPTTPGFVMIGERTNVTGSARFRRLSRRATTRALSRSRSSRCEAARTSST